MDSEAQGRISLLLDRIRRCSVDLEGVTRDAYGSGEDLAFHVVREYAEGFRLSVRRDSAANLVVRLPDADYQGPRVTCGSHLDSVPNGGNFDGAAGVVAGLEALRRISQDEATRRLPIELVAFRGEESAWFGKCYLGSLAMVGKLQESDLDRERLIVMPGPRLTKETLGNCMRERGVDVDLIASGAVLCGRLPSAYFEVHIEQGPVLEAAGIPLGVVSAIRGNIRFQVKCIGEPGHSGTVPRKMRHDAVMATASFLSRLYRDWAFAEARGEDLVVTAGVVHTDHRENAVSRIPSVVDFALEWRSLDETILKSFMEDALLTASDVSVQHGVSFDFGEPTRSEPAKMDEGLSFVLDHFCKGRVPNLRRMPSGAGHDAAVMAMVGVPSAMLFVRNAGGSHNPAESMRIEDLAIASEVLADAMVETAKNGNRR